MNPKLLNLLCDPVDKSNVHLQHAEYDERGRIIEGLLVSESGRHFPIRHGIPRFIPDTAVTGSVESFGDEWNFFNFDLFKLNWLNHTVKNTFGSTEAFLGKVIVDAGGGSGAQSLWMSEAGAEHVICLELSHSVDGVIEKNLENVSNVDVVQCSIDHPPIKDGAIKGIVICHNVIQHTPTVEDTARALWRLVGQGGEFVFNCYPKNDHGLIRKARLLLYSRLRAFLSKRPFRSRLTYSRIMSMLRFIPLLGPVLELSMMMVRGDVPKGPNYFLRAYRSGVLNTFDFYGAHSYQHLKRDEEILALVKELQPDSKKVCNVARYFSRPQPIGIALRVFK